MEVQSNIVWFCPWMTQSGNLIGTGSAEERNHTVTSDCLMVIDYSDLDVGDTDRPHRVTL